MDRENLLDRLQLQQNLSLDDDVRAVGAAKPELLIFDG
jgi:hypothetical protein